MSSRSLGVRVKRATGMAWAPMASECFVRYPVPWLPLPSCVPADSHPRLVWIFGVRPSVSQRSTGCINALNWSSDGTLLASGSDDTRWAGVLGEGRRYRSTSY